MIDVIPGILEFELSEIENKVNLVASHVDWIQIDFMDGSLVPNKTFMDIDKLKNIISSHPAVSFEAHLMVANPEKYVESLSKVGFKRLIAHVEANDPRLFLDQVKYESVEVGLALDGSTEIDQLEPLLEELDTILIMTIEAGSSGQMFLPESVEKIKSIREILVDIPIEVDGGINETTARLARDAGATRLVSTSYIFKDPRHIADAVSELKGE
jgi:ribulose-phosphate 3-epimerase